VANLSLLRSNVRANLQDFSIGFFDDETINQLINDGYQEVASRCRCIIKSAQLQQIARNPYYDFIKLGVSDYLGVIGIFNQDTQFWLRDDISIRDYDRLRRNWEIWTGQPQFWTPHSLQYVAIAPNLTITTYRNLFTVWYWAQAPQLINDTDVPLIATDKQTMLEFYATAECLEDAKEFNKATDYWAMYEEDIPEYKTRCINLAKADMLQRI
jgi:hypothetical protein